MLLSNIAACHIMLKDARLAINAARESVLVHPSYTKGYIRLATALIFQTSGNANFEDAAVRPNSNSNAACQALQTALRYDPNNRLARKMLLNELRARDMSHSQRSDLHEQDHVQLDGPNAGNTGIQQPPLVDLDEPDPLRRLLQQRLREQYQSFRYKSLLHWSLLYLALYVSFGGRFGLVTERIPTAPISNHVPLSIYPPLDPPPQPTFQRVVHGPSKKTNQAPPPSVPTYERVLADSYKTDKEKHRPQPTHQTLDKDYYTTKPKKNQYYKTKSRGYSADPQSTILSVGAIVLFSVLVAHWTGRDPLMAAGMVILRYFTRRPRRHRARGRWQ